MEVDDMQFNRIAGFFLGSNSWKREYAAMSIDEKNQEVNRVFDSRIEQLNAAYELAEKQLRAMRVVVDTDLRYGRCDVAVDDDPRNSYECFAHIGVIKLQGQWRICHGYSDECNPDVIWKPIRDATVHERIAAARHIDKLREEIVRQKEKTIPRIESAVAALAHAIERFENQSSD
jgi:hypothetical protein